MTEKLAIEIDEETFRRLKLIGQSTSLSERQVAEKAVRSYTHDMEPFIKAVRKGQDDIKNGNVVGHGELIKELESRLADLD